MHNRPLTILAVSSPEDGAQESLEFLCKQFKRDVFAQYVMTSLANFLSEEMNDCSIIARRNNHFVIVVPEADRDEAEGLVHALRATAKERLNVNLCVGQSSFPQDATTLVSLLERAETQMSHDDAAKNDDAAVIDDAIKIGDTVKFSDTVKIGDAVTDLDQPTNGRPPAGKDPSAGRAAAADHQEPMTSVK